MKNSPKATKGKNNGIWVRMAILYGFLGVVPNQPIGPVHRFEKLPTGFRGEALMGDWFQIEENGTVSRRD